MVRGAATRFRAALLTIMYVLALTVGVIPASIARADALIAYSGSGATGLVENEIDLSGIAVSGSDPVIPITLDISDKNGILYLTDTTGITFNGPDRGSRISFSGSVADVTNALASLKYRTLSAGTWTLSAMIIEPGVVYNPGNGHLYEVVDDGSSHSWDDAKTLAEARSMNGASGYLATVTSSEENDYLVNKLQDDGWFGASDSGTEGDWKWVTGPEAGTSFWLGNETGAAVSGRFSNWSSDEPNDYGGVEDCAQFYSNGSGWNDLPCSDSTLDYYVVEYGAPGDMPTVPENVSFEVAISEPSNDVVPITSCLDLLDIADNNELDNRYDTLSLSGNVDCSSETLTPMFDEEDSDFGEIGFRGTFDGNGFSLTGIHVDGTGSNAAGLFARLNDADVTDITLSGDVVGDYCIGGVAGTAVNSRFTDITSTVDLQGYDETGGLVGCYEGWVDGAGSFSGIEVNTIIDTVEGDSGGVVGDLYLMDESELSFSDITVDVSFTDNEDNRYGGVFGDGEVEDRATITFSGITIEGPIVMPDSESVGGIGGEIELNDAPSTAKIEDITIEAAIEGHNYVGGVFGEAYGYGGDLTKFVISDVHLTNDVSGSFAIGGLAGHIEGARIVDSSYTGTVTSDDSYVGGLVGEVYYSEILNSYSNGEVTGGGSDLSYVGGLAGYMEEANITRSYSTMNITNAADGEVLGGLAGYIYDVNVTDSYARGNVSGYTTEGGLIGYCDTSTLTNTYSTGSVDGEVDGGLLGDNTDCVVENSFWDTVTSTAPTSPGDETGKTTTEMKNPATFLSTATEGLDEAWDFATVWGMSVLINDGYPCLQWQDNACDSVELEEDTESTGDDEDIDGIPSAVEDAGPNGGDANNDGTPDSQQNFVSSFVNPISSSYMAVEVSDACSLSSVSAEGESAKAVKDSGYDYNSGLMNFTANCGTAGYTTTVQIFAYGVSSSGLVLRKHNPVTATYFTIGSAEVTQRVIAGQNVAVARYQLTDGSTLDTDGAANGVIVDPVGLATLAVGVPNTGFRR